MKQTIFFFLFTFFSTVWVNAQSKIKFRDITFDQAMSEAAKTNKVIMVDVRNNNANPMVEKVEKEVFSIDSIADYINKNCIPIRINMNTNAGKEYAPRLQMLMYPVYVFHDRNGDQLNFINSAEIVKDPNALLGKVSDAIRTAKIKSENKRHIAFEKLDWKDILAKAKKEKKLIFVDAYTVWCRPCIQMAKDVFTLDKVADFYNGNFINVSMDMEKGVGPSLAKKYNVTAYPTFLFIDGSGKLVHTGLGFQEADAFIEIGKTALTRIKTTKK